MMLYFLFLLIVLACACTLTFSLKHAGVLRGRSAVTFLLLSAALGLAAFSFYAVIGRPDLPQKLADREERMRGLAFSIERLSEATRNDPGNAENWAALGMNFTRAEQYPAAIRAYRQAVLRSGGDPGLILELGRAYMRAANGALTEDAKKAFEMVLRINPDNEEAKRLLKTPQD